MPRNFGCRTDPPIGALHANIQKIGIGMFPDLSRND